MPDLWYNLVEYVFFLPPKSGRLDSCSVWVSFPDTRDHALGEKSLLYENMLYKIYGVTCTTHVDSHVCEHVWWFYVLFKGMHLVKLTSDPVIGWKHVFSHMTWDMPFDLTGAMYAT